MRINLSVICGLLLAVLGKSDYLQAEDWHQWRGPDHNGISREADWNPNVLKNNPQIKWQKALGAGYSSVCIKDSKLYTMGYDVDNKTDVVYCLDEKTGATVWKFAYNCKIGGYKGPRATPVWDENRIYTFSQEGHLHCLDAGSGKSIWMKNVMELKATLPKWGFASSAWIEGRILYINAGHHGMAFDKSTGDIIWTSEPGIGNNYSTPLFATLNSTRHMLVFAEKGLMRVNPESGKLIWTFAWPTELDMTGPDPVIIDNNKIFLASRGKTGCALVEVKNDRCVEVWKNNEISAHFSTAIYHDGYIYGIDGLARAKDNLFKCLDAKSGKVMWSQATGFCNFSMADKYLVMMIDKGDLVVVEANPAAYKEIARQKVLEAICWTAPVVCNGAIYCRNDKGTLLAINAK